MHETLATGRVTKNNHLINKDGNVSSVSFCHIFCITTHRGNVLVVCLFLDSSTCINNTSSYCLNNWSHESMSAPSALGAYRETAGFVCFVNHCYICIKNTFRYCKGCLFHHENFICMMQTSWY